MNGASFPAPVGWQGRGRNGGGLLGMAEMEFPDGTA